MPPRSILVCVLATLVPAAAAQTVGHVWTRHTDAPVPRFEGVGVPIDGRLYVFGGFFDAAIQTTRRVDVYDPATDSWSRVADLPTLVTHAPLVRDGRKLWLVGGFVGHHPGLATTDVWVYDIDLDTWTSGPPLPRPIASGGAAIINGRLHYYGGVEIDRNTNTGDHWVLDLSAPQLGWVAAPPMPEPRCHLTGVALGGLVYAVGGQFRHDTNPVDTASVHVFDPVTNAWSSAPALPAPRSHAEPGAFVLDGRIHLAGGKCSLQQQFALSDVAIFDPATQRWSFGVPLPIPRYGVVLQPLGDRIYFATGADAFSVPHPEVFSRHKDATLPSTVRINVGGAEYVSPFDGRVWTGDFLTQEGEPRVYPGVPVTGTNDPDLFRTQRRGAAPFAPNSVLYRLPMGTGFFRCRCHFADLDNTAPGQRVFDIRVEGRLVADDIDAVAQYGQGVAFSRAFDVLVADDELDVQFQSSVGGPSIAALELEFLASGHFERECTSLPNSSGAPARLDFIGSTSLADDSLRLLAHDVPTNTFGIVFQGTVALQQTIPGGILCVGQPQFRHGAVQAIGNTYEYELVPSQPPTPAAQITAGSTWRFQGWFRDGGTALPWGFTDALKLVFTP
jgi:N-acetylneuraminic acid mutarotase